MKNIKFQDEEYLFGGDSLDESGFIAKREVFENGECSYAHYYPDQGVMRFQERIGGREDIEILGNATVGEPDLLNMLTHPSWERP